MHIRLILLLPALLFLTFAGIACGGGEDPEPTARPKTTAALPTAAPSEAAPSKDANVVKVQNQDTGGTGEYKFVPKDFTFKVGDTITFEMSGETEFHTFTVDELGIDEVVDGGETVTFKVTFDKPGEFELICITHQAFGMTGTITVTE